MNGREVVPPEGPLYLGDRYASADMEVECGCVLHSTHGRRCGRGLAGRVTLPLPALVVPLPARLSVEVLAA